MFRQLRATFLASPRLIAGLQIVARLLVGLWLTTASAAAQSTGRSDRAIPPQPIRPVATPTAVADDAEVTIVRVATDRYPRLSVRFTVQPFEGSPPVYLQPRDVVIVENGVSISPDEVDTVDRVPTGKQGTYEAIWQTQANVQAGDNVDAKLAVFLQRRPEIVTPFRFVRPMMREADARNITSAPPPPLAAVPLPDPNAIDIPLTAAVASIFAGTTVLCIAAALAWRSHLRRKQERLNIWVKRSAPDRARAAAKANAARKTITLSPLVQYLGKLGGRFIPSSQTDRIRRNLVLAGRPTTQHYTRFVAMKAGGGIGLFLLGFWLMVGLAPFITALAVALCMGIVGYVMPSTWLGRQIKKRQYELRKALPDALDLMTIGVSAGLAFDGAIGEIIEKWDNDLSREFSVMLGELRMGTGRRDALLNLADRTQVEEIQIMVSQLIQADELGMSLTETLLTLSGQMRLRRRQHAEELAQKAAVKMLIPLVFLIFPALFVVILGPAAQDLYVNFMGGGG